MSQYLIHITWFETLMHPQIMSINVELSVKYLVLQDSLNEWMIKKERLSKCLFTIKCD